MHAAQVSIPLFQSFVSPYPLGLHLCFRATGTSQLTSEALSRRFTLFIQVYTCSNFGPSVLEIVGPGVPAWYMSEPVLLF
jgi:hypothetical protein